MRTEVKAPPQANARGRASLKIGEVSRLSGVGIEALRFYERSGLLGHPSRTESGYRMYDIETLDRLAFIKRAQVLGFSLDEIKQIIRERQSGQNPCAHVREVVRQRLGELDERMKQMKLYRKELAAALSEWDEKGDDPGHICGLIEGSNIKHDPSQPRIVKQRKERKGVRK